MYKYREFIEIQQKERQRFDEMLEKKFAAESKRAKKAKPSEIIADEEDTPDETGLYFIIDRK